MSDHDGHVVFADCLAELTDEQLAHECGEPSHDPETCWCRAARKEAQDRGLMFHPVPDRHGGKEQKRGQRV